MIEKLSRIFDATDDSEHASFGGHLSCVIDQFPILPGWLNPGSVTARVCRAEPP